MSQRCHSAMQFMQVQHSPKAALKKPKIFDHIVPTSFKPISEIRLPTTSAPREVFPQRLQCIEFLQDESIHLSRCPGDVKQSTVTEFSCPEHVEIKKQMASVLTQTESDIQNDPAVKLYVSELIRQIKQKDEQIKQLQEQTQQLDLTNKENQLDANQMEFSFFQQKEEQMQQPQHPQHAQHLPSEQQQSQRSTYFQCYGTQNQNIFVIKPTFQTQQQPMGSRKSNKEFFSQSSYY